jgi:hypothetical protein
MFYIGVDLGQKQDYTAIAIVEREDTRLNPPRVYVAQAVLPVRLLVRRVRRVALGTPYPRVVELIRDITCERALEGQCALVVDGTGVGAPVVDMLRAAGLRCEITAVTITGGEREPRRGSRDVGVPKRDLIAGVQLGLEKGELRIARRMKEAGSLVRELVAMKIGSGGGEAGGEHDDLVIALALACWRARRRQNGYGEQRLPCY